MTRIQPLAKPYKTNKRKEQDVWMEQAKKGSELAIRKLLENHGIKFKREVEPKGGRSDKRIGTRNNE